MEYSPRQSDKRADVLVLVLFIAAVILFGVSNALTGLFHVVPQIGALVCVTAALYLAIRYRLTSFRYVISDDDGDTLLTVYRSQGRRSVAEARMSGVWLESVERFTDRRSVKEAVRGMAVYDYTLSMKPQSVLVCVFVGDPERKTALILECDGDFAAALGRMAEENRRTDGTV